MPSVTGTISPLINLKSFDRYKINFKKYSTSTGNILREKKVVIEGLACTEAVLFFYRKKTNIFYGAKLIFRSFTTFFCLTIT